MAATILQAPLPSVHHHYPYHLNAAPPGSVADPWSTPFYNFRLLGPFPRANPSTTLSSFSSIAIATDELSPPSEMSPIDPPSPPASLRKLEHPPRLHPEPTSPVEIQGKVVRRGPEAYVDRVAKLRNPAVAVATNAASTSASTSSPPERRENSADLSNANTISQSPQLQAPATSQGSLVARRRRRSPNPDFKPPRLTRTQPEGLWAPLTGDAHAIAAAFRERSPSPAASSRRTLTEASDAHVPGSSDPVPATPTPRTLRRASSSLSLRTTPLLLPRTRMMKIGKSYPSWVTAHLVASLVPQAESMALADMAVSTKNELGRLSISSSDEEEEVPAPPPPPRRRRGLNRSTAGRFRVGERGGLELDEM
ncbi:hypothetical protein GTA08_BOTSDO14309 [Botryosphaeria dothidea]|uniref:Uncharacterized protein n=1 Tax=Botryosphaeria dothidea TaxID=55169 RepID=A0A8H4MWN4_9PEZI|nr:hypothetical protein GTA08_BOTSDO14309 [Botryosphaeria dothidea]